MGSSVTYVRHHHTHVSSTPGHHTDHLGSCDNTVHSCIHSVGLITFDRVSSNIGSRPPAPGQPVHIMNIIQTHDIMVYTVYIMDIMDTVQARTLIGPSSHGARTTDVGIRPALAGIRGASFHIMRYHVYCMISRYIV